MESPRPCRQDGAEQLKHPPAGGRAAVPAHQGQGLGQALQLQSQQLRLVELSWERQELLRTIPVLLLWALELRPLLDTHGKHSCSLVWEEKFWVTSTLTFCPCRFRTHTAVFPGGGRGSDSSPDASMSEEQYWVLMGEGKEESESPSLSTGASGPVLAWVLVVS